MTACLGRERSRILLAERDGAVLACAHVAEEDGTGYFGMFSVKPDLQGGGIGKHLAPQDNIHGVRILSEVVADAPDTRDE